VENSQLDQVENSQLDQVDRLSAARPELLVPNGDVADPLVSIVVPALNEEVVVSEFVRWCHQGLRRAGVRGEILIVDSSSDSTPQLALAEGARVLRVPQRGLGRAYIDALPSIRGEYVLLGDADCTYDFREIDAFVERFRDGYEFVMGTRRKGFIAPGSMPVLHRYLGTPVTTWILNRLYSSDFSDIHCGMRGITRDAFLRMDLQSQSWEYASEMVLKSVHMHLRTIEVPVRFLKDREGRVSQHRRAGWSSPWRAAWINLRAMFVYGADFFLVKPGAVLLALGLLLTLPLTLGSVSLGPVTFSLYWSLAGVALAVLGLQSIYLGILARLLYESDRSVRRRWLSRFRYNRTVGVSAAISILGVVLVSFLVVDYLSNDLRLPSLTLAGGPSYKAVTGLLLIMMGFSTFTFTLVLHAIDIRLDRRDHP
jgi:glycosyltransferase involved in cell wall biosynthesis